MGDFRDAEIGEPQPAVGKQQQVVRLHVAVDDVLFVGEGHRPQQLLAQVERGAQRQPPRQSLFERLLAQRQRDHEVAVDEVGTLEPQDIRMIELRGQPHFARKVVERFFRHQTLVRNLQRHVNAFERIERTKHRRIRPIGKPRLEFVLADFLAGLEQGGQGSGFRVQVCRIRSVRGTSSRWVELQFELAFDPD